MVTRTPTVTASVEEYVEWIYRLSKEHERVSTSDLARVLDVAPASVTSMLRRLQEQGLANYQPYHGVSLTDDGKRVGARMIRRHGLLERLLCDVLGFPWHLADEAVQHLGHYINDEVEERLASFLGYPSTCPHGQPIDWEQAIATARLSELDDGKTAVVSRIGLETPDFLHYVESIGLLPGAAVEVLSREPFDGPMIVRVAGQQRALGPGVSTNIWMDRASITGPGEAEAAEP